MKKITKEGDEKEVIDFICPHCHTEFKSDEYLIDLMPVVEGSILKYVVFEKCYLDICPNCKEKSIKPYNNA